MGQAGGEPLNVGSANEEVETRARAPLRAQRILRLRTADGRRRTAVLSSSELDATTRTFSIESSDNALFESLHLNLAANRPPTAVPNPAALTALASEVTDRLRTVTLGFEEFWGTHQEEVPGAERLADRDEIAHHPEHPARTQRRPI